MYIEPQALLIRVRLSGMTLFRKGSDLEVGPKELVTEEWLTALSWQKDELLAFLPDSLEPDTQPAIMPAETLDLFVGGSAGQAQGQTAKHQTATPKRRRNPATPKPKQAPCDCYDLFDGLPSEPEYRGQSTGPAQRERCETCETQGA